VLTQGRHCSPDLVIGTRRPVHGRRELGLHLLGFVRQETLRELTTKFSSGAGWTEVMPRKAVLPAPSAATAASAMLFLWNRIPTPLFSFERQDRQGVDRRLLATPATVNDVGRLRGISRPRWGQCRSTGHLSRPVP
jgi:hypothetical protein